jgi:hypothetical protein
MNIDEFTTTAIEHYVIALLWSEVGDNDEPLDGEYGPEDMSPDAMKDITTEVTDFVVANWQDVKGMDAAQVGHDFLLTRNRHGAGFWDRGLGEVGERLTANAHPYGETHAYVVNGMVGVE